MFPPLDARRLSIHQSREFPPAPPGFSCFYSFSLLSYGAFFTVENHCFHCNWLNCKYQIVQPMNTMGQADTNMTPNKSQHFSVTAVIKQLRLYVGIFCKASPAQLPFSSLNPGLKKCRFSHFVMVCSNSYREADSSTTQAHKSQRNMLTVSCIGLLFQPPLLWHAGACRIV